jgi:hypothetical protein
MRVIPIDSSALELLGVKVLPKMTRVEQGDQWVEGPQKRDAQTNLPVWDVVVMITEDANSRPEVEMVAVPAAEAPVVAMGPVRFENFVGRPWLFNGRAGLALSASAVAPVTPQGQPQKRGEAA